MKSAGLFQDFLEHLFPRKVRKNDLKLSYTFCLGGLCVISFLVLIISGLFLSLYYRPDIHAYESILIMESSIKGGIFLRSVHRYGADLFVVFLILHCLRVIFTGAYLPPRHMNWIIGCILFVLCLFEAYLGYVLVQDKLGVWAFETGMNLFNYTILTRFIYKIFIVDGISGEITLIRVYIFHIIIIPAIIFVLCSIHFYKIRKQKGVLPYL